MTLTQLRYVIAVAESKSMNEASKQLFVSQPSLSSAIKELEAETGVEIFRRSNKGVVITPEGEEFIGLGIGDVRMNKQEIQEECLRLLRECAENDIMIMNQARENGTWLPGLDSNKGLFVENHKKYWKKIMELRKIEDELEE